jgi:Tol biopolymer transport system component
MLAKGPDYQQRIPLAPSILAAGDLTWSPSGAKLAFLAFRPNENLYTIMSVSPDGSGLTDLFPADLARTDKRTSQKAILGWKDENTLQVMSSCGEECRQSFDININTQPGPVLTPTPVANYRDLMTDLETHRKAPDYKPEEYPRGMRSPNWSPDSTLISYLDKRGFLWMLIVASKTIYPLDIGLRDVYETRWSSDSRTLGIRAEDRIFVFEIPCKQPLKK